MPDLSIDPTGLAGVAQGLGKIVESVCGTLNVRRETMNQSLRDEFDWMAIQSFWDWRAVQQKLKFVGEPFHQPPKQNGSST